MFTKKYVVVSYDLYYTKFHASYNSLSLCLCLCLCVCVNSWVWFISNIIGLMIISTCLMTVGFVFVTYLEDVEVEDSRRRARAGESKQFHWAATLGIRP